MQFRNEPLKAREPSKVLTLAMTVYERSCGTSLPIVYFILAHMGLRPVGEELTPEVMWRLYLATCSPDFGVDLAQERELFDKAWRMIEKIIFEEDEY